MEKARYLRLSITDRCNLRCIYCTPFGRENLVPAGQIMRFEEIVEAVKILSRRGIDRVRITGGEPLVRRGAEELVKMLRDNCNLKEITMTTNALLLREKLPLLVHNGLNRINISLNTFKRDRFLQITGVDRFDEALSALKEALDVPELAVKINMVVLKGINDDEIEDFAAFTLSHAAGVRFIEYFPVARGRRDLQFVPNSSVRERVVKKFGGLIPCDVKGSGPAVNFRIKDALGHVGFISARSEDFCHRCNRLRLTAKGDLYPCLYSSFRINLKDMMRGGAGEGEIGRKVDELIAKKKDHSKKNAAYHRVEIGKMGG